MGHYRPVLTLALLGLLLSLAGCARLFDTEYTVSEVYQTPAVRQTPDTGEAAITDYDGLRQAILDLVADRAETAQLQLANYDGDVTQDIAAACWEVKSATALGAFGVDNISYDLRRIVSYYQADMRITYARSAEKLAAVETVDDRLALADRLDQALRAGETYLALEATDPDLTAEDVRAYLAEAYHGDLTACPALPEAAVSFYPETGPDRIAEIALDYGMSAGTLAVRRDEVSAALGALAEELSPAPDSDNGPLAAESLYSLCQYLADVCAWDENAGSTVWDALVGRAADSQGLALAMEAGCDALGFECVTVAGRLDGEEHFWNIVTLAGGQYHVDVSRWTEQVPPVFLAGDRDLWGTYWWDTSEVPACPDNFGYFADLYPTPDPDATPAPTPAPIFL